MLTDTEARRIASYWYDSSGSALYALSSTGAIDLARFGHDVSTEICECVSYVSRHRSTKGYQDTYSAQDYDDLMALLAYVKGKGSRGPVENWSDIRF